MQRSSESLKVSVERCKRILRRGRLTAVAVVVLGLFAVAGAGAATGILSRDDAQPPPPAKGEVVLASGEAPVGGPWRLTAHRSEALVDGGEQLQPAGLPCLQFILLAPPEGQLRRGWAVWHACRRLHRDGGTGEAGRGAPKSSSGGTRLSGPPASS